MFPNCSVKESNSLPSGGAIRFYRDQTALGKRISTIESLLKQQMSLLTGFLDQRKPTSAVLNGALPFDEISDHLDSLAENVALSLDKLKGKSSELQVAAAKKGPKGEISSQDVLTRDDDQMKPQLFFEVAPDNSSTPFVPILKTKPHSLVPIDPRIGQARADKKVFFESVSEDFEFEHPYKKEIEVVECPTWFVSPANPPVHPGPETPEGCSWVDSVQALGAMMNDIRQANEIAVDLEHHAYRSFLGFTCLMQLSTRTHDYLIDTIALREHLQVLNQVFTNPDVVKVFHGADMDIKWLQRDFGIYVVGLFDTHKAAQWLKRTPATFASLLLRYCNQQTDKEQQLADWRIRPLTEEMVKYARRDTHFLLYIADCIKADLKEESSKRGETPDPKLGLLEVWKASKEVSAITYRKPAEFSQGFHHLVDTQSRLWSSQRIGLLRRIWSWRSQKARTLDESEHYVLPTPVLVEFVAKLPTTHDEVNLMRKRFSRLTATLLPEILKIFQQVKKQFQEENEAEAAPAVTSYRERREAVHAHVASMSTYLKPVSIEDLVVQLKELTIAVGFEEPQEETFITQQTEIFSAAPASSSSKKDILVSFAGPLDFLKTLNPGLGIRPPVKRLVQTGPGEGRTTERTKADEIVEEFIQVGRSKTSKMEEEKIDYAEKVHASQLPASLKEKFGAEIIKVKQNAAKRDVTGQNRQAGGEQSTKVNEPQEKSREIFQKGNVFEILQSKETDQFSDEEEENEANQLKGEAKPSGVDTFWSMVGNFGKSKQEEKKSKPEATVGNFGHRANKKNGTGSGGKSAQADAKASSLFAQPSKRATKRF